MKYDNNLLKSVLLLTLAVSGNFVGNTLSCKTQYNLTNNMLLKHLLLFFIIFFTLSYTKSTILNPNELLKNSLIIWVCFLMYTKQNAKFTIVSSLLIVATYVLNNYEEYYNELLKIETETENDKKDYKSKSIKISKFKNITYNLIVVSIISGFLFYLYEKKKEYGENFDPKTFIFGKVTCDSLK